MGMYPHKHDNAAPVYLKDGKHYVSHADLLAMEYGFLEDFSIVYVNGKFWELQGYIEKPNAWWIEPVETEGVVANAPPEEAGKSAQGDSQ